MLMSRWVTVCFTFYLFPFGAGRAGHLLPVGGGGEFGERLEDFQIDPHSSS